MDEDDTHPMDSPAPITFGVALIALLVLSGLMIMDFVWQMEGPTTLASPAAPPPQPAPPPG